MSNPVTFVFTVSLVPGSNLFNFNVIRPDGNYSSGTRDSLKACQSHFEWLVGEWNHYHEDASFETILEPK